MSRASIAREPYGVARRRSVVRSVVYGETSCVLWKKPRTGHRYIPNTSPDVHAFARAFDRTQLVCSRKQTPYCGARYAERTRRARRTSLDVAVAQPIAGGDVERRRSRARVARVAFASAFDAAHAFFDSIVFTMPRDEGKIDGATKACEREAMTRASDHGRRRGRLGG